MWSRKTPAESGGAKDEPRVGDVGKDGELVRKAEPAVTVVAAEEKAPEAAKAGPTLEERLAGMEKEVQAAKERAAAAERRAQEAEQIASKAGNAAVTNEEAAFRNHKSAIENAAVAVKGEMAAAKAAYIAASEAGRFNEAAEAQEAIAEAKAKQMAIATEQRRIKEWEERPREQQPQRQQASQQQPQRPRDALNLNTMPANAAAYLNAHPEYLDDWGLWNKLTRAHQYATEVQQLPAYSDDYFRFIDESMGGGGGQAQRGGGALPPSRSGPAAGGGGASSTEVPLTARQREAAHFCFPEMSHHDAEVAYAKNLVELQASGRMTRH